MKTRERVTLKEYMRVVENRPDYWNIDSIEVVVHTHYDWWKRKTHRYSPWEIPADSHLWNMEIQAAYVHRFDAPYLHYRDLCIYILDDVDPFFPNGRGLDLTMLPIEFI
jgi:hypothetical protein